MQRDNVLTFMGVECAHVPNNFYSLTARSELVYENVMFSCAKSPFHPDILVETILSEEREFVKSEGRNSSKILFKVFLSSCKFIN